jgi:hypothetical protein
LPAIGANTVGKEELSNLLQMANDNGTSEMVKILRQVKELGWHEGSETTYGGSLRYSVKTEPNGTLSVLFGINVSDKYRPLHDSLCVWIRREVAARYCRASLANVQAQLDKFAPFEIKEDKCFCRISNTTRADDLLKLLKSWSADSKSTTANEKSSEISA